MRYFLLLMCVSLSWAIPTFGSFSFDGHQPVGAETIAPKPVITVPVTTNSGVLNFNSFELYIDSVRVTTINPVPNYEHDIVNNVFRFTMVTALTAGTHTFELFASDGVQSSKTTTALVAASNLQVLNRPYAYPSPATTNVTIGYELTDTVDIEALIYAISGTLLYRRTLLAGETGARAGWNAWSYDLKDPQGRNLPNGVYVVCVVGKDKGARKVLGKTKFMVLR